MKKKFEKYFELSFWILSLSGLYFLPMPVDGFSFCPFHMLGLHFCPGCGLGKSIHLAFHGEFSASFRMHPFGIPAIFIITSRIISIFKQKHLNPLYDTQYQPDTAAVSL
ncbi:MAG: DUF2752 domain-containing protein [Chitinophagaceae bacterium]|nr:DUF2752 domain-containing protein [Chitinophagaceae bacterium]